MQDTDSVYLVFSSESIKFYFVRQTAENLFLSKKIEYCCIFFANFLTITY